MRMHRNQEKSIEILPGCGVCCGRIHGVLQPPPPAVKTKPNGARCIQTPFRINRFKNHGDTLLKTVAFLGRTADRPRVSRVSETWRDPKHEPQGQLLGQRGDGEFLRTSQVRMYPDSEKGIEILPGCGVCCGRIHGVLQPPPPAVKTKPNGARCIQTPFRINRFKNHGDTLLKTVAFLGRAANRPRASLFDLC